MSTKSIHSFHIPVMGLAFTIDSPIRVARYGIDSVISIMDDELIEKMRAFYAGKFRQPYEEITSKTVDFRAKRITGYLNLVDKIVSEKFEAFKKELTAQRDRLVDFLSILPSGAVLRQKLEQMLLSGKECPTGIQATLDEYFRPGSIDVNIMTKVDKENFEDGELLPAMYNDAHAALRGFANSTPKSAVVFSAGMNPRLYSYIESFDAFYPDASGHFQKKIILKVSDFRSALIQGNFLAKKGLWVSEYRVESGLNCGGHAFATDGHLLGPILEEFKNKRGDLGQSAYALFAQALAAKNKPVPAQIPEIKITVQGGVGTAEEHRFLLDYYQVDAVGWGSPFLLVPEATSVDEDTRRLLAGAGEKDLYLSNISPLGVPFNTVRGTTNEFFKNQRIASGKAGSSCPKKFLALSKEYDTEGSCTASKKHQDRRIADLKNRSGEMTAGEFDKAYAVITEKSCLCVGLANASHLELGIPVKGQPQGVVVCPGPNIAYFSKIVSLKEMIRHIYGAAPVADHSERPHMFLKELELYISYLAEQEDTMPEKKKEAFRANLLQGIAYYQTLFPNTAFFQNQSARIQAQLEKSAATLQACNLLLEA